MAVRALTLAFPIVFVAYNAVQGFLRMDPENTADGSADIRTGDHQPTARISTGIVQGFSGTSREGRTFYQFLGLPYAQPPVGDLRFESPVPVIPWTGTLVATKHQNPCLQLNFITGLIKGSEDCLYLNVFTPRFTSVNGTSVKSEREGQKNGTTSSPLLPVMVFIYGGYFMYGAAHHYGPTYFMDHDVVLVTFNYRVGALGFLNTGDRVVRGNMGLKDQNMVLRWVQENISQFGGDPTRVTLFGESAGASSVHFHILSPMSAGLFHKAISQSGTAVRTWQVVSNPGDQARKLGKILECPTQSTKEMVSCLKGKDGSELVDAHINRIARLRVFQDLLTSPLAQYAPSVEGIIDDDTFLARPPMDILKSGNFSHVPWICGVNSEEGLVYSARITRNRNVVSRISRDWKNVAPILLNYDENRWEVADRVREFYLPRTFYGWVSTSTNFNRYFQEFTNLFSDRLYNTAAHVSIREHAKYAPVYAYYFSYVGEFTFYNLFKSSGTYPRIVELGYTIASNWVKETIFRRKRARYGVCHGDDLPMFFNLNLLSTIDQTEADYPMSQIMTATWVQFAYNDTKLRFRNHAWPHVNPKDVSPVYMLFNDTNPRLIREPFTDRARFWEGLSLVS